MVGSVIAFLETLGFPPPFAETLFRLLLGAVCGGLIGLERELKGRPAGLKTFSLVCMGAALVMVTNEYICALRDDYTGDANREDTVLSSCFNSHITNSETICHR